MSDKQAAETTQEAPRPYERLVQLNVPITDEQIAQSGGLYRPGDWMRCLVTVSGFNRAAVDEAVRRIHAAVGAL